MAGPNSPGTITGRVIQTLENGPGFLPDLHQEPLLKDLTLGQLSCTLVDMVRRNRIERVRVPTDVDVYKRKSLWLYGLKGQLI